MSDNANDCLSGGNRAYLQDLQEAFQRDPDSLSPDWREFFRGLAGGQAGGQAGGAPAAARRAGTAVDADQQSRVLQLINSHRFRGHRQAQLDPLQQHERPDVKDLHPGYYGFTEKDMDTVFDTGSLFGPDRTTLREICEIVQQTYCHNIGAEYMHITETAQKRWIQERLERCRGRREFSPEERRRILQELVRARTLEQYLHNKYVGQKRFSLEGGESLIPLLHQLIARSGTEHGTREFVIGMAHRGRLNVLVNVLGKSPQELFQEFEDLGARSDSGSGDVKYHMGYSADARLPESSVHLTLAFNPSHLEIIGPVVEGSVRARQDRRGDIVRGQVLPVLIHGDAAFAGQGVVAETFNLSQARGYATGGTVHIIVNNQIGFTTSDPLDARSTLYCTDVAKMVQAPVFHVNADDIESLIFAGLLALEFRMAFSKDVVIDIVCYRRHGHSEADEPAVTQPIMYRRIRQHPDAAHRYAELLVSQGAIEAAEPARMAEEYIRSLEENRPAPRSPEEDGDSEFRINFQPFRGARWDAPADTRLSRADIARLGERLAAAPEGFRLHPSVARIMNGRRRMSAGEAPADWGFAEALACASLVEQGFSVRISGQDCGRGTFFHRHAVLYDQETGRKYQPLQHVHPEQASFLTIDSTLSEEAVLAFEYGYSSAEPNALVIWEAQFGDFANGAQVIFDQFLSSCEAKWARLCGLTVFLPHGYDGQGPEHSSARPERLLQLCAEENMQVCMPSQAAQMFHLLRRQMLRPYRKPLIVLTPKSLLRQQLSASPVEEFADAGFCSVFDERDDLNPDAVRRLILCAGKVYYDLLQARRQAKLQDTAILRIEQLYPFPERELRQLLRRYPRAREITWAQEEPENQGMWGYMQSPWALRGCLKARQKLLYAGRRCSAAPAGGSRALHLEQQQRLVAMALQTPDPTDRSGERQRKSA